MAAWQAVGKSVCGSHHRRQGLPAQDAIALHPVVGGSTPGGIALAVADGHGGAPSFRSHIGAQMAVATATALLIEYGQAHAAETDAAALSAPQAEALAQHLVERWRESVLAHLARHPLEPRSDEAPGRAGTQSGSKGGMNGGVPKQGDPSALLSYGTTVLAALAMPDRLLCCQLGDGDILLVSGEGEVRRAWPRDQRLLGGETTSLCMPEAWREMRVSLQPLAPGAPALVLLCTDGYANSFRKDKGFLRVGRDILEFVQSHGIAQLEQDLESWLTEASDLGSGDDITVGLLYRSDAPGILSLESSSREMSGVG